MKLLIATPAYDGKVNVPYAIALSETVNLLTHHGIQVDLKITTSGSLLCAERNRLIEYFRHSDSTHMLCIDADLGWPAMAVKAMLDANLEFVGGCYPARGVQEFLFRTQDNPDGTIMQGPKGHLKMNYIPAGFLLLKKSVIEKMVAKFPNLYFKSKGDGSEGYCLFDTEVFEGEFWGEDFVFCRRARESGVDIWVDPLIEFDHAGTRGMLASLLKKKDEVDLTNKGSI
jgi:hypothetical protein